MLREKGFNVLTESSARQAIEMVRSQGGKIDVALTDLRMPEMDGIQLLDAIHRISPDIVTVMATGYSSAENAIAAMRAGAYDFVRKPVDFNELEFVLSRAVERRRLRQQIELHRLQLESTLDDRTRSLRSAIDALENSYMATMEALSTMLAMREASTALHNKRVSEYSVFLARRMNLGSKQIVTIRRGALIHDIGKIGIPDAILLKPGPLTPEEWQVIRQHPTVGYQIVNAIPFLQDEAEMVLAHHERHDGKGYPRGQAGEAVCLGARIFAVVDAFDALRTDRVYRKAVSLDAAVKEIRANSGTQFDPAVVTVFLDTCAEMDHLFNR
jgi:response regulator RpfG family c-di-GMP phosphodiesterase